MDFWQYIILALVLTFCISWLLLLRSALNHIKEGK